ncbi:MAG: 16S rRNA (uracil(1498)-N(3))-methyltransferase [Hydrogenophilus sp.]|nr:16S rRNA (uracil(1498)-N(3))-methyltransferase [Hydrogenophilus sp.]
MDLQRGERREQKRRSGRRQRAERARFCVRGTPLRRGARLGLPKEVVLHLAARRLHEGEWVQIFDGEGNEWLGQLVREKGEWMVVLSEPVTSRPEPSKPRVLATALLPAERVDWVVQKGTELGMTHWLPLVTAYGQVTLSVERAARKLAHWRAVATAAAEQCGRSVVPEVLPVTPMTGVSERLREWFKGQALAWWWLDPEGRSFPEIPRPSEGVVFFVGPEGGWSEGEQTQFAAAGGVRVAVSPWIARAETAAVAVLALAAGVWGVE